MRGPNKARWLEKDPKINKRGDVYLTPESTVLKPLISGLRDRSTTVRSLVLNLRTKLPSFSPTRYNLLPISSFLSLM